MTYAQGDFYCGSGHRVSGNRGSRDRIGCVITLFLNKYGTRSAINKKRKYFLFPDNRLAENFILVLLLTENE